MSSTFYSNPAERGAMSVSDFCAWAGISRASFYRLAGAKQIRVRKIGSRSVVTQPDAFAWLNSLPNANINNEAA